MNFKIEIDLEFFEINEYQIIISALNKLHNMKFNLLFSHRNNCPAILEQHLNQSYLQVIHKEERLPNT